MGAKCVHKVPEFCTYGVPNENGFRKEVDFRNVFFRYPSFAKAKVIRDKRNGKSRGFGFVSFLDPQDFLRALKEMNGKYVGNRPVKLKKSNWKSRTKAIKNFKPGMRPNNPTKRYDLPGPV